MKELRRFYRTMALGALSLALPLGGYAQWNHNVGSGSESLTNPTPGVTVGTNTGTPPSALTVRGNEMSTPTGDVFETDAPSGSSTYWRLRRDGTERGRLFNVTGSSTLVIDASTGPLHLFTNSITRAGLNGTGTYTIGAFAS